MNDSSKEKHNAAQRKFKMEHPERVREQLHRWYESHRDEKKKYDNQYRIKNRERIAARKKSSAQRYRARLKNAEGFFSRGDWELLKKQYGYKCPVCGKGEPKIKLTPDHVIPLSRGGSNWIENIQPLCIKCNVEKRTKIWRILPNGQLSTF